MCLIIDNNRFGDFLNKAPDTLPIHKWLQKKGSKLVFTNHSKFKEYAGKYQQSLKDYAQAGKLKLIDKEVVERQMNELHGLKSNDAHIVALCLTANAKVVFTDDRRLHKDIKNIANGSVYQFASHRQLLKPDICP